MGETENTEISDESEPTEEQIKEEEEVIPDEAGLGETVPTEEEVTEEPADGEVTEEQEENSAVGASLEEEEEIPAVGDATAHDVKVQIGNDAATTPVKNGDSWAHTASGTTVTFTGGMGADAAQTAGNADLTFTVTSADPKTYDVDQVSYQIGTAEATPMEAVDVYTIEDSAITDAVTIIVEVTQLHTVTFDVAENTTVAVNGNEITSTTETKTVQVRNTADITFTATAANETDYNGVKVTKDSDTTAMEPTEAGGSNYMVTNITADCTLHVTPIDKWSKVTMAVAADSDADATVTFGGSVDADTKKAEAGKDITFDVAITDGVDKVVDTVTVTDTSGASITADRTLNTNTWTIAHGVFDNLTGATTYTVKVALKAKEYKATLPNGSPDVTWEYQEKGAEAWTATTNIPITVTSGKTIVLRASVADDSTKKYSVTVGKLDTEAKDVYKKHPATWEFTTTDFGVDGTLDLSGADTKVAELVDITVEGSTTEAPFSVKYFKVDGDKTNADALKENAVYTAAVDNKIPDVPVGTKVYLQIDASGKEVASITGATAEYGDIGTVYSLTAATAAVGANTVTVTLDTSAANVVNITKDANVKAVTYKVGATYQPVPANGKINLLSTATEVSVKVVPADNYEIAYVHKDKGQAHAADNCTHCVQLGDDGAYTVTLAADAATEIEIKTRKQTLEYTVTGATSNIDIHVEGVSADAAAPETVSANSVITKVKLGSGDTYNISASEKVADKLTKDIEMSAGFAPFKKVSGTDPIQYRFTADKTTDAGNRTFAVTVNKKANKTVTFTTDGAQLAEAPIKTDKYTKLNGAETATEEVPAADFAAYTAPYQVFEGTGFRFQLKPADNYTIKAVKVQVGTAAATPLTAGDDEFYVLESVTGDTIITVETEVDSKKAFGIKIAENPYVASASIDWTGAAIPATVLTLGKEELSLTAGTDNKVNFSVKAKPGYKIDKVLDGSEEIKPVQGQDYYQVALAKGDVKEITVQTKASENTTDKFVKLIASGSGEAVPEVKVTAPAGMEPVKPDSKIYKLTGKKDTTPGIDEITVEATVGAGYTLDTAAVTGAGAILASEKDGTYTFTISAGAAELAGATAEETAAEFTFSASKDMVTLKTVEGSNSLASVKKYAKVGGRPSDVSITTADNTETVDPGSMIVVTVMPGDKLLVNGEAVELKDNSWSGIVELGKGSKEDPDTYTFKAVKKEDYKVQYTIKHAGEESASAPKTADGSDIDVKYGDQVELSLVSAAATAQIIKAEVTGEGEVASTAQLKKNEDTNKNEKAVIDVKDAGSAFNVVLTVEDDGTEYATTKLAPITFQTKTTVADVTVKGITKGKENKLDATSRMTYPLTVKADSRTVLNAADYADMLTAVSADTNVATVEISNGNLVIETKTTGKTDVTIKAVNQTGEDKLFTFTVAGQDPAKKMNVKTLASSAQGMNDLYVDITPNATIKEVSSSAFNYYYEVQVETKKINEKTQASDHKTGYYYYPATVTGNQLQAASNKLVVNSIDSATRGDQCGNTYTFSAKLIAVKSGTAMPAAGTVQAKPYEVKDGEFASDAAVKKDFSTRNAYFEDKLGVTKKTTKITSGQTGVLVAIPKFSAKAGYIDDVKVEGNIYNPDGTKYRGYGNYDSMTASWESETNEIKMTVEKYVPAGKYNLVIEATAHKADASTYDMYRACATVPITVVGGISSASTTVPDQIAQTGQKDVSITLKTTGWANRARSNSRTISYKPAVQKFEYTIDPASIKNNKNKDQVVVKGNKVTIKKGFIVSANPENNKFIIGIKSKDVAEVYTGSVEIEVTDKILEPTEIYLTKDGKTLGNTLTTLEADNADVVVKAGSREINSSLLTYTPAYNGKKTGISTSGSLYVVGKGTLALKAATTDGGRKSVTRKDKYTISYPKNMTYSMAAENSNGGSFYEKGGKYQYSDPGNGVLQCTVMAKLPDDVYNDQAYTKYFNYSVSVKGGKIIDKSDAADGCYGILPNAKETVVTVIDKENRNTKINFTFVNLSYVDAKAPAATTKNKLYLAYDGDNAYVKGQELKYTLKDNKDGYNAVKFTAADVKSYNIIDLEMGKDGYYDGVYDINENNEFFVGYNDGGNCCVYPEAVGTAKYNVVYGMKNGDIFYPKTKPATLSVKVNKLANMKPNTKYTINTIESLGTPLTYKPVDGVMYFDRVVSANVGGRKNKFYEFFKVEGDKLTIRNDAGQYEKLMKALADDPKTGNADFNPKEDLTGYLEYHYYTVNGVVNKSEKITVTVKADPKVKYAVSAVNVLAASGVKATTSITLGKSDVMIASAKSNKEGWTAVALKGDGNAATNKVELTCTGTPEKGKVEFYVIPADSPKSTSTDYAKDGILVSANVTVLKDDDATAKAVVDKKKNLTPKAAITGQTVTLTAEAVQGSEFKLAADGYAISGALKVASTGEDDLVAAAVTDVKMKPLAETPTIVIQLDRDKAMDAAKKDIVAVPVELTFNKGTAAKQTITLNVKLPDVEKIKAAVPDLVKKRLDGYALEEAALINGTTAAAAVKAYADAKVTINPMSGIVIEKIEAVAADKWGEGEGKSYGMTVTLKDVTAKTDATTTVDITVKKKVVKPTVEEAVSAAVGKIVGTKNANEEAAKTELLVTESTTKDDIAAWIEKAIQDNTGYDDIDFLVVDIANWSLVAAKPGVAGSFSCDYAVVNTMNAGESLPSGTITLTLAAKPATTP